MLGDGDKAIAHRQQQDANQGGIEQRTQRRQFMAAQEKKRQQQRPRREETHPRHQQGRPAFHPNADDEIGGAPDDIERKQGAR